MVTENMQLVLFEALLSKYICRRIHQKQLFVVYLKNRQILSLLQRRYF